MTEVVLSLGSNLGDRMAHLRSGVRALGDAVRITGVSPVVETPAREVSGGPPQDHYLNAVVRGRTGLEPEALLEACHAVEAREGRTRSYPNAPRTLDVDILFYGDRVVETEELTIPHPRWTERDFVLVPLRAVAPEWTDPASGRTVSEIARERLGPGAAGARERGERSGTLRRVAGPEALHDSL